MNHFNKASQLHVRHLINPTPSTAIFISITPLFIVYSLNVKRWHSLKYPFLREIFIQFMQGFLSENLYVDLVVDGWILQEREKNAHEVWH
jgi:hypothetical protein